MTRSAPRFSIVIPTYNRPQQLANCLAALTRLDYPRDQFEVIAVDDGGSVALEPVVAPFREHLNVQVTHQPNQGPAAARNTGAAAASGEYLAFTDDDCIPLPGWLRAFDACFADYPDVLAGGYTRNHLPDNFFTSTSVRINDVVYRHYNANPRDARFFTSNNIALARSLYHAAGGFDPIFSQAAAEDREFCDRWRHQGRRMILVPDAVIEHAHALTLVTFWRMFRKYGHGAHLFHEMRGKRRSGNLLTESRFHLDVHNWLWTPITEARGPGGKAGTLGLLLLWQIANAVGYFEAALHAARQRPKGQGSEKPGS